MSKCADCIHREVCLTRKAYGDMAACTAYKTEADFVRRGRWIKKTGGIVYWYACPECGEETPCNKWGHRCFSRFCPSCGSRWIWR